MKSKNIIIIALATAGLLLIPLIAMQFTAEVDWSPLDFIIMGILLFSSGLLYEFIASRGGTTMYKAGAALAVGTGLLLIWANLAVGIIGDEDNPANLLYLAVLGVALTGAFISRFRPEGMMRALFGAAAAHAVVTVIAMLLSDPASNPTLVNEVYANAFFVALWSGAAMLFRHAGYKSSEKKAIA